MRQQISFNPSALNLGEVVHKHDLDMHYRQTMRRPLIAMLWGCSDAGNEAAGAQRQREGLGVHHRRLCGRGAETRAVLHPLCQP